LVNSAAIWVARPLAEVTPDDVRRHFEINTLATFVCAQQAGLVMAGQTEGGAIVNIGDWAIERPYRDYAAYFAAKGSIPTLTRSLAVELAALNPLVRVSAVLPGPVLLPEGLSASERDTVIESTLVKREGTVAELADAVLFLLENKFITGVSLPVDGGRSVFAPAG
jgi:pteridine reductase